MVSDTPLSVCATDLKGAPVLKVILRLRKARSSAFELSASSAATKRGSASMRVTSTPSERQADANSTPITPPPSTNARSGSFSSSSACSLASTRVPSISRPGRDFEYDPEASTRWRPSYRTPETSTVRGPTSTPRPSMTVMPWLDTSPCSPWAKRRRY